MRTTRWFLRELERRDRQHQDERDRLIAVICSLAGRPIAPSDLDQWRERIHDAAAKAAARQRELDADLVDYDQTVEDL